METVLALLSDEGEMCLGLKSNGDEMCRGLLSNDDGTGLGFQSNAGKICLGLLSTDDEEIYLILLSNDNGGKYLGMLSKVDIDTGLGRRTSLDGTGVRMTTAVRLFVAGESKLLDK